MADSASIIEAALREVEAGRAVALAAIVAARGSTPQPAGAMLCVDGSGKGVGTLGGGCVEADVCRKARALLGSDGDGAIATFELDHDYGHDDGMICGGQIDMAIGVLRGPRNADGLRAALKRLRAGEAAEISLRVRRAGQRQAADGEECEIVEYRVQLEPQPRLVIVGGGHIGRVLAGFMVTLGFRVTVIDDRVKFTNSQRFPPPIETVAGDISRTLSEWPIDANTYIVIVTRGHRHDERALAAVLGSPAGYIGMIGSRRKVEVVFDDLREAGATPEQLGRIHAPIGLDINAVTTEEIGLSIAAQLVAVRRSVRREVVQGPFPVESRS